MKHTYRRSMAIVVQVLWLSICATEAHGEDSSSVASGFFKKNMVNEMFAPRIGTDTSLENDEESTADLLPSPKKEGSFAIGTSEDAVPEISANATELPRPIAAVKDPHTAARAIRATEQVIRQVPQSSALPTELQGVDDVIEAARTESESIYQQTKQQPRAMFGGSIPAPAAKSDKLTAETPWRGRSVISDDHSEVSLHSFLSAIPATEFEKQLKIILRMRQRGVVPLRQLSVVGLNALQQEAALQSAQLESNHDGEISDSSAMRALQLFNSLNPSLDGTSTPAEIESQYQEKRLPLWVVMVGNVEHLFPGNYNPTNLFSGDGRFVAAERSVVEMNNAAGLVVRHRALETYPAPRGVAERTGLMNSVLTFRLQGDRTVSTDSGNPPVPHTLALEPLPQCKNDQIRRVKVPSLTKRREIDVVFYSPTSSLDAVQAQRWSGAAVAYEVGSAIPLGTPDAVIKRMASSFHVRCLPTRFHFTEVSGERFLEYREGSGNAWSHGFSGSAE